MSGSSPKIKVRRTLLGVLNAQRSRQLYEALRPPSGNHEMSPSSNEPERTCSNGVCQYRVSFAIYGPVRAGTANERRTYLCPPLVRAVADSLGMECLVIFKAGADMGLGAAVGALHAGGNLMDIVNRVFCGHGEWELGVEQVKLELVMGDVWEDQTTSI